MCIHIYIYIYICIHTQIYIYTYILHSHFGSRIRQEPWAERPHRDGGRRA